jgi:uncharacterized membrane protein
MAFAASLVGLGILGLATGDFASVWQPVPKELPGREAIAYLCALISLFGGAGLLWRRPPLARRAAGLLLVYLLAWLLLLKAPDLIRAPGEEASWLGCGEIAVLVAAAWALCAAGARGGQGARLLFGLSLLPLGLAHLTYLKQTAAMVPAWLPLSPSFWAGLTGATYLAAGVALLVGRFERLAAALTAQQMGLFALLVWVPMLATSPGEAFRWGGLLISLALAGSAWALADADRTGERGSSML